MAMETRLARVTLGAVEMRNPANFYNPTTVAEAQQVAPTLNIPRYLSTLGVSPERFSFPHRAFFAEADRMLREVPVDDWKAYLRWNLLRGAAPFLSSPFERESFRFYQTVLSGTPQMQPRWKRARGAVDAYVGEALGQLYVAEAFPPEAKAKAMEMIDNIRAALRTRLEGLEWMGPETRARALAKLATFTPRIGYPDEWRDYSAIDIEPGAFLANVRRATEHEARRQFAKVGKPVNPGEWAMTPQTVNAYYNPLRNEIVFPAGIMQPPFFDPNADDAVNYGAMGAIIGHEIMHGFDDQGSQFDAEGNFSNWWTEQDKAEFTRRAAQLVEQYGGYVAVDSLRVNGQLTLGENIGDLGGLIIAYDALQRSLGSGPRTPIDGFTPEQRFFLSFAQAWRGVARDEAVRLQVQTDPHSPRRFRAVGPVSNMPEFARAFRCSAGDPMVRSEPVRIW
jgi:putative endopeptidase